MHGEDLTITLFFFTSAVLAGFEAMKASGWRLWAFWILTALFAAIGLSWLWLKEISPTLTRWVGEIATSPQSWFVLIILGLVLLAVTGRKSKQAGLSAGDGSIHPDAYDDNYLRSLVNDVMQKQANLESQFKQAMPDTEAIRQLNRTAFLLSTAAVDSLYRSRLELALHHVPWHPKDGPIDTDEKILRETKRIDDYFDDLSANLYGSRWSHELDIVRRRAEGEADHELPRMGTPNGLNPYHFRLFHIACMQRDRTSEFLKRAIVEAEQGERQMLQMLRERPEIHK